jgi:hypothetical protein
MRGPENGKRKCASAFEDAKREPIRASVIFFSTTLVRNMSVRVTGWEVWICQTPEPQMKPVQLPFSLQIPHVKHE